MRRTRNGILTVAAVLLAQCRTPTDITVEVTTDVRCRDLRGAQITVGKLGALETAPARATTLACDEATGRVGALVIVPSGDKGEEIGIRVVAGLGRKVEECTPPYGAGCIVARRALRYVPHTELHLSVAMRGDCNGIPCGATETCVRGTCRPALVEAGDCKEASGCGEESFPGGAPAKTCGDTRGIRAGAAWPIAGYCPSGRSRSPLIGPKGSGILWKFPLAGASRPLIGTDGTVYAFSSDGNVYAVDRAGKEKWRFAALAGALAMAADGTLYVGAGKQLIALDESGKKQWESALPSLVTALSIAGDGTILASTTSTGVVALDAKGSQRWSFGTDNAEQVVTALDGTIYVPMWDGFVYAVTPLGKERWRLKTPDAVGGAAIGADGTVYATSWKGSLTAISPSGAQVWSFTAPVSATSRSEVRGPALAADGTIYAAHGATLRAFDATGKVLWTFPAPTEVGTPSESHSRPVVDGAGTIYFSVGNAGGSFGTYVLDSAGKQRARIDVTGTLALGFDSTLIVAEPGTLYAIGP